VSLADSQFCPGRGAARRDLPAFRVKSILRALITMVRVDELREGRFGATDRGLW